MPKPHTPKPPYSAQCREQMVELVQAGRKPSPRQQANEALALQIHSAFTASDDTYGMLRVRAQLRDDGVIASRKRLARLMRQHHWCGVSRRRSYCVATQRDKRQRPAPDLVSRQFVATDINQL